MRLIHSCDVSISNFCSNSTYDHIKTARFCNKTCGKKVVEVDYAR